MAAGAVMIERWRTTRRARTRAIAILVAAGAATVPFAMPILPIDAYVRYSRALGQAPSTEEKNELGRLPQFFADRQGWDVMTATIADVWNRLPPEDHADAAVLVCNYGEAGALERLVGATDIVAISGHNNYWLWGTHGRGTRVLIVLSGHPERLRTWCAGSSRRARPRAAIACPTRITSRSGSAAVRRRRSPRCGRA